MMFSHEVQFSSGLMEERIRYWNAKYSALQAISILEQMERIEQSKREETLAPRQRFGTSLENSMVYHIHIR